MSDILIKNMKMPKAGQSIEIAEGMTGIIYGRLTPSLDDEWHEVIEVPPHGRLIDADALKEQWLNAEKTIGAEKVLNLPLECFISYGCVYDLDNAPTIIGAEGTKE